MLFPIKLTGRSRAVEVLKSRHAQGINILTSKSVASSSCLGRS